MEATYSASSPDILAGLTDRQKRFVLNYIQHSNGARAAREAGYAEKSAAVEAVKQLRKPLVKAAISSLFEAHGMSAGECIGRLTNWGRGSLAPFVQYVHEVQYNPLTGAPFVDLEGNAVTKLVATIDLTTEEAKANIHLLKKIKQGQYGLEIELTDPKSAVDMLLQVHGRYRTKIDLSLMTDEQLDELLEKALAKIS